MAGPIATAVALVTSLVTVAACTSFPPGTQPRARVETLPRPQAAAPAPVPAPADAVAIQGAAPAESPATATNEYRLGPGDIVKITVYNNPDLTTETEVLETGNIGFPLIGEVKLGGLTRSEAEKRISQQLGTGKFVPNAYVNLMVVQYRSQQISVMGEVNKPGKYSVSQLVGIADVLAMAGGITSKGSNRITIIQKDRNGRTVQQEFDIKKVFAGEDAANVRLGNEDIIYVPAAPVFYIYGEVRQPGAYPLAPDMTVRQALSLGGGLTVRGTERGIELERKAEGGKVLSRRARITEKLRPNDVLRVPESWF